MEQFISAFTEPSTIRVSNSDAMFNDENLVRSLHRTYRSISDVRLEFVIGKGVLKTSVLWPIHSANSNAYRNQSSVQLLSYVFIFHFNTSCLKFLMHYHK